MVVLFVHLKQWCIKSNPVRLWQWVTLDSLADGSGEVEHGVQKCGPFNAHLVFAVDFHVTACARNNVCKGETGRHGSH